MRRYTSVDAVTTALLGALGVLTGCGGSVSVPGGESAQVQGDAGSGPDTGHPVAASCAKHPCADPQPLLVRGIDTGFDTCASGTIRRRATVTCPSFLPRTQTCAADGGVSDCTSDTDCNARPYGRSEASLNSCYCSYGNCRTDSDCISGLICLCGDPVGACVQSECSADGGCGAGCDCEMTTSYRGFACQTPEDTCASTTDCVGQPPDWTGQNGSCSYTSAGATICAPQSYGVDSISGSSPGVVVPPGMTCQPTETCVNGRPFLVHGAERTAGCVVRPDWQADLVPDVTTSTESQRFRAAAHWARVGAMEHASIAAFARFTLHLLSLGAPAELITLSQQAMGDETEHARLAYALASAYADLPLGPGPLAIHGSLDASTTDEIVATLIREGCIGETMAAIEARDALEHDLDPAVRTALEIIARDELRHAELAWKTLAWLLESDRVNRRTVRDEVTRALGEMSSPSLASDEADDLAAFGVVTAARRAGLREQAAHDIITRCIDSLVGRTRMTPARPSKVAA